MLFRYTLLFSVLFIFPTFSAQQGAMILAGGGAEGEKGDTQSWSYLLYQKLLQNGEVFPDGILQVAILTTRLPRETQRAQWLPLYFEWIGKSLKIPVKAFNCEISTKAQANSLKHLQQLKKADVIFIKGGDQGKYYDLWNETAVEKIIWNLVQKGGSIGGTSAGAMSLAGYSFSGSSDLISADVLMDSHTAYLNDVSHPNSSAIHHDFFPLLPNCIIDTHYTQRGRMGRAIGLLAKASEDFKNHQILCIGIEQKTGLFIQGGIAEVLGKGEVAFLHETKSTKLIRKRKQPLIYTDIRLDRLTHGWRYHLKKQEVLLEPLPKDSIETKLRAKENIFPLPKTWPKTQQELAFEFQASIYPKPYQLIRLAQSNNLFIPGTIGFYEAGAKKTRMDKQETLFQALSEIPSGLGFLIFKGSLIKCYPHAPAMLFFEKDKTISEKERASLVIDVAAITHKGISPFRSNYASKKSILRTTSIIKATVHVLADSYKNKVYFNLKTRKVQFSAH